MARVHRELYKKDLHDPDNQNGVITNLDPDIMACKVKWALGSITMNKASGGDGIPVELFQIQKDDTVKVLQSICQQIWKTQQWLQDWKRLVFIPIQRKAMPECSNYCTIALISLASKGILKILQARLQQYVNRELPDVQTMNFKMFLMLDHQKSESSRKTFSSALFIMPKPLTVWTTKNVENSSRGGNTRPPDLPLEKSVCRSGSNS